VIICGRMIRFDKHKDHPQWLLLPRIQSYPGFPIIVLAWLQWSVAWGKIASDADLDNCRIDDNDDEY